MSNAIWSIKQVDRLEVTYADINPDALGSTNFCSWDRFKDEAAKIVALKPDEEIVKVTMDERGLSFLIKRHP